MTDIDDKPEMNSDEELTEELTLPTTIGVDAYI